MKTPHKHAELIKAWADGATIQCIDPEDSEDIWEDVTCPAWMDDYEYRIKPEPKPDVVQFYRIDVNCNNYAVTDERGTYDNLRLTFDGETRKLKSAEVV